MEEIISLSQELNDKIKNIAEELDPAVIEAIRSAKHTLTAAIASTRGVQALPEKDNIPPNQRTWTETAERMGVKRVLKRRLPKEIGITDRSIGIAKGKRRRTHEDPYAGGERSGKHAKPDALSAAANARVRAGVNGPFPHGPRPPVLVPPMALPLAGGAHFLPGLALASPLPFPPPAPPPPALACPVPSPVLACPVPPPTLTCPVPPAPASTLSPMPPPHTYMPPLRALSFGPGPPIT